MGFGTQAASSAALQRRQADRRVGMCALFRQVANQALGGIEQRDLPALLADRLGGLPGVRGVRLTDVPTVLPSTSLKPVRSRGQVAFVVPVRDAGRQILLEAVFEPGATIDEWTCQILDGAASVAALLIEAERLGRTPVPAISGGADSAAPLVGTSDVMCALRDRVERVANTNFTVLIEGESGVGKELVARQVHAHSRRRHGPFVAINCAALVETLIEAELFGIEERTATGVRGRRGKFEDADGGTLFLDEVSDLSLAAQAKLLRAVQDLAVERVGGTGSRRVNIRIVAATNRPLSELVERRLFRPDLFYRLSGVDIKVPPLRRRRSDVPELVQHFLSRHRGRLTVTASACDALVAYDWPGNVRELERMIEGAVATAESMQIRVEDLPASLRGDYGDVLVPAVQMGESMRAWGSRYARLVLERHAGNKRKACEALDISYHTLNAYLRYRPQVAHAPAIVAGQAAHSKPLGGSPHGPPLALGPSAGSWSRAAE